MARRQGAGQGAIISLLTDFGTADGYVGAMKGVILGLNPRVTLVDVTHEIPPQEVRDGAFVLHTVHRYFPPRAIHLAVVDPGVGTDRAALIVDTGREMFVLPDNGLLSYLLAEASQSSVPSPQSLHGVPLPEGWRAVRIAESRYWLPNPSTTFHGRDVFAPVAAHLSLGVPLEEFGPAMESLLIFPIPRVQRLDEGELLGSVIHVDRFGNLITNLTARDLPRCPTVVEIAGHQIRGLSRTYAEGAGLVALVGSSGYLEIALPGGSAREAVGLGVATPVRVVSLSSTKETRGRS